MTEEVRPAVGQLWQDNDKRVQPARFVRINAIVGEKAVCEAWYDQIGAVSRTVHISLKRFRPTSTGYRFVRDDTDGAS